MIESFAYQIQGNYQIYKAYSEEDLIDKEQRSSNIACFIKKEDLLLNSTDDLYCIGNYGKDLSVFLYRESKRF